MVAGKMDSKNIFTLISTVFILDSSFVSLIASPYGAVGGKCGYGCHKRLGPPNQRPPP